MHYEPVTRSYWADGEREEAEDKATAFVNAFRRLGIDFDDIELQAPSACKAVPPGPACCIVDRYRLALGCLELDDAEGIAERVSGLMDELAEYRAAAKRKSGRRRRRRRH